MFPINDATTNLQVQLNNTSMEASNIINTEIQQVTCIITRNKKRHGIVQKVTKRNTTLLDVFENVVYTINNAHIIETVERYVACITVKNKYMDNKSKLKLQYYVCKYSNITVTSCNSNGWDVFKTVHLK